jgi:ABC transporter substrate binding protein (PQQ-dependent alcohol dehydrogenase system)
MIGVIAGLVLLLGSSGRPVCADGAAVSIAFLSQAVPQPAPRDYLDAPPADEGVQGARLAIDDNNTTGRFTGQTFALEEFVVPAQGDVAAAFQRIAGQGVKFVVTDLPATLLAQLSARPEAVSMTFFNAGAADDDLRGVECRANLLHTIPSRQMLADALVQYLVFKRWRDILLVVGRGDGDAAMAAAYEQSARKFQAHIVARKPWTFEAGARRSDTGNFSLDAEVARLSQGISYDVLVVADGDDEFADDLAYHTFDSRPIAGDAGMIPTAWARPYERWGATQLQNRFLRLAHRWMTDRDYAAWLAVRAVGEAATRTGSVDPPTISRFLRSDQFDLAGFKGTKLTFRSWDGQLRQPILLSGDRALVSVSPQPGFLHQVSELDTLGVDQPETKCKMPSG